MENIIFYIFRIKTKGEKIIYLKKLKNRSIQNLMTLWCMSSLRKKKLLISMFGVDKDLENWEDAKDSVRFREDSG